MSIDVIKLAEQADEYANERMHPEDYSPCWTQWRDERFAALVLEEAEKACKEISDKYAFGHYGDEVDAVDECRSAIRALKPQE